jgi:hypothetical protein
MMAKKAQGSPGRRGTLTKTRRAQQFMIRAEADDAVNEAIRKMRLSKVAAVSALYLWFAKQPPAVQQLVVGILPEKYAEDAAQEFGDWVKAEYPAYREDAEQLLLS